MLVCLKWKGYHWTYFVCVCFNYRLLETIFFLPFSPNGNSSDFFSDNSKESADPIFLG